MILICEALANLPEEVRKILPIICITYKIFLDQICMAVGPQLPRYAIHLKGCPLR